MDIGTSFAETWDLEESQPTPDPQQVRSARFSMSKLVALSCVCFVNKDDPLKIYANKRALKSTQKRGNRKQAAAAGKSAAPVPNDLPLSDRFSVKDQVMHGKYSVGDVVAVAEDERGHFVKVEFTGKYKKGDPVYHRKYGRGKVVSVLDSSFKAEFEGGDNVELNKQEAQTLKFSGDDVLKLENLTKHMPAQVRAKTRYHKRSASS